ncbi:MAG: VOC family protein [Burkholderiaceae bacterium]
MLHHISLGSLDIDRAALFYDAVLFPLGYVRVWSDLDAALDRKAIGYGPPGSGDKLAIKQVHEPIMRLPGFHLAFASPSRQAVIDFYEAAMATGGIDYGRPGLRPHYGPNYYAAFVIDPDGHHLEAVCTNNE